jgi:hypothetical protein
LECEEGERLLLVAHEKTEHGLPPDTLETGGVNELFHVVTVDTSFTTEQTVSGPEVQTQILSGRFQDHVGDPDLG